MVLIWIFWTGSHLKTMTTLLCPPFNSEEYCASQASQKFVSQLLYIFILIPIGLVGILNVIWN